MEYTTLGSTGLTVSTLCFGTGRFGQEIDPGTAHDLLDAFADRGGNFIDTANSYGGGTSERLIGEWLADRDREQFVVASKVYRNQRSRFDRNLSRKNVRAEIEGSLDRLGTDYLDVYYVHWWDDDTPIRETLRTFDQLVDEGKVHYLGLSNAAAWKLTKSLWVSDADGLERFEVTQPPFNAADRPADYLDVCADQDLAVCPYSPLETGFLADKYTDGEAPEGSRAAINDWDLSFSDRQWRVLEAVRAVADEVGATPAQVALRWLVDRPRFTTVPIFAASAVEQVEENVGAVEVSLSGEQRERITEAYHD